MTNELLFNFRTHSLYSQWNGSVYLAIASPQALERTQKDSSTRFKEIGGDSCAVCFLRNSNSVIRQTYNIIKYF